MVKTGAGPDPAALVIGAALLALAALVFWDAYTLRTGAAAYARIGPRAFPYAISGCLALVGLLTLASAFKGRVERPRDAFGPMAWIVGGLLAQLAILPFGGFALATGAVFAGTARAFGRGPLWLTYPLGVAFALGIWVVFARGLNLVLPIGPLERLL